MKGDVVMKDSQRMNLYNAIKKRSFEIPFGSDAADTEWYEWARNLYIVILLHLSLKQKDTTGHFITNETVIEFLMNIPPDKYDTVFIDLAESLYDILLEDPEFRLTKEKDRFRYIVALLMVNAISKAEYHKLCWKIDQWKWKEV